MRAGGAAPGGLGRRRRAAFGWAGQAPAEAAFGGLGRRRRAVFDRAGGQVPVERRPVWASRRRRAGVLRVGIRRAVFGSRPIFVRRMRVCQATKIYPELTSPCSSANNVAPARVETPTLVYRR
jgi:hypothetical protein